MNGNSGFALNRIKALRGNLRYTRVKCARQRNSVEYVAEVTLGGLTGTDTGNEAAALRATSTAVGDAVEVRRTNNHEEVESNVQGDRRAPGMR